MKLFKHIFIAIIGLVSLILLIPTIVFAILHFWVLTPEYLTSTAKNIVNEYTFIDFKCEKIELDYLNSWPSISLAVHKGEIRTPAQEDSTYTKVNIAFQKLYGNIELSKLLTEKSLQIETICIEAPKTKILKGKKNPILLKKKEKKSSTNSAKFKINQINVANASFDIKHYLKDMNFEIKDASLIIKGNLTGQQPSFNMAINCGLIGGKTITDKFGKEISFSLKSDCIGTTNFNDITLSNTSFYINQLPFHLDGRFYNINKKEEAKTNLRFHLSTSKLKEITDFIPADLFPEKSQYLITGNTTLEGSIKGNITSLPDLKLKCMINNGSLYKKGIKKGIDTISLCINFSYMKNKPDSCFISIDNTKLKGLNSHIQIQSHISNLQHSPFVNADFKGYIDFDHIGKEFISPNIMELKGKLESDLSIAFNLKDFKEQNINRIWTNGTFNAPYIKAHSDKHNLDVYIAKAKATIGYKKNKSDFIKNDEVISANFDVDTLNIQYNKSIFINLSKFNLRSNTALTKENKTSTPITAHLNCEELQTQLNQGQWIYARTLKVDAGSQSIAVSPKNEAGYIIETKEFQYIDQKAQNAIAINNGKFIAEFRPGNNNKWDFKGLMNFQDSQIYTSHYPIDLRAQKARISIMNNQIAVNHVQLNAGESNCILSGILTTEDKSNPKQPKLKGSLRLLADYINYNELKRTLLYHEAAQREFKVSNIQNFRIGELNKTIKKIQSAKVETQPFFIPKKIDLTLNVNINEMNYEEIILHQINGDILIKEQKVYTNLSTRTNLGKVNLNALYNTADKKNIQTLFDLKLQDVLIAQIHKAVPTINTLFPMVESMDGLINCHLTLSSQLDNQMMPIVETTEAICSIDGQNLTLMNHKVFQEIAKRLKFKNKEKNIIDYLSANMILQNNQVEVIPFQIKWDRYEAVVGGTHTTDFTYNYHISMLKSLIPFNLGIDLYGKTDEMHYKVSPKCKFTDLYKDGGITHNRKTQERLNQQREKITKNIAL